MEASEAQARYYKATKEAESEMQCWIHALSTEADVVDRLQIMWLWRAYLEGSPITPMTMEMMLEATNS